MSRQALKDSVFMKMAQDISELGTCCRLKVGAILLRDDGSLASGGFNGALPGMPHCTPETCNSEHRCLHTSHAEENALEFCSGVVTTAYVTHEPCLTCTRALARRGIRRVVFAKPYTSIDPLERSEREQIIQHFEIHWEHFNEHIPLTEVLTPPEHIKLIRETSPELKKL